MSPERERFETELLPHFDAAYRYALRLTGSSADAQDLVQEAMLLAYRKAASLRGANPRPWVLAIVRNCFYSRYARERDRLAREPFASDPPDMQASAQGQLDPQGQLMSAQLRERLLGTLEALAPEYREALTLRELEDLSYREIATVLGVPIGTVMSRLARARDALRASWLAREQENPHELP